VNVAAGVSVYIQGIISESGGARTLTKTGTGTLYLERNNTYTGLTTVSGGGLEIGN